MKYILILIYAFGNLIAQETKLPEKTNKFNLTIKRATLEYIPFEYTEFSRNPGSSIVGINNSNIRNNQKSFTPIQFRYHYEPWNLYTEASYQKIEYDSMGYYSGSLTFTNGITNSIPFYDLNIRDRSRTDSKLNFYSSKTLSDTNIFYFGLGYRNTILQSERKSSFSFFNLDPGMEFKVNTNGIQIYLKHEVKLSSFLSFGIGLEPFHTQGLVNNKNSPFISLNRAPYLFPNILNNYEPFSNGKIINLRGYDLDINFKFRIYENLDFLVGYTRNQTYFSSRRPITSGPEKITGYYFGITAKF